MGNIIGEGFHSSIIGQVDQRQKVHGRGFDSNINGSRSEEDLVFLNNNTAWCKLVSSTVINGLTNSPTINKLVSDGKNAKVKIDLDGDNLAKKFILFNGTATQNHIDVDDKGNSVYKGEQREGIDLTNSTLAYDNVYGIGGSSGVGGSGFGLRPMPGIISAKIQHKNRGSIRTAEIKIRAFNKAQFEIIDILYLRLGFSVLLEWGNSIYYNNNGKLQKDVNNSLASTFLSGNNYLTMLDNIRKKQISTEGNYDAIFGKVTNFHWSFLPDGSYDITLNLISAGDIIESFKINTAPVATAPSGSALNLGLIVSSSRIENGRFENLIGEIVYDYARLALSGSSNYSIVDFTTGASSVLPVQNWYQVKANLVNLPEDQMFIRLGSLLEQIEQRVMYQIKGKNSTETSPILRFDTDINENLMAVIKMDNPNDDIFKGYTFPNMLVINQVSYNPLVCTTIVYPPIDLFNTSPPKRSAETFQSSNFTGEEINNYYDPSGFNYGKGSAFHVKVNDKWYGRIMNVYLNASFILDKLAQLRSSEGRVNIIDFLKEVLDGIVDSLGAVNQLDLFIDETQNLVKIIDKTSQSDMNGLLATFGKQTSTATFDLYGYDGKSGASNFIKDFKFVTELTPEFATLITIGATSNGEVVGENATALSRLNRGVYDQYKKEILTSTPSIPPGAATFGGDLNKYQFARLAYSVADNGNWKWFNQNAKYRSAGTTPHSFYTFLDSLYGNFGRDRLNWNSEWINSFKQRAADIFRYYYKAKGGGDSAFPLSPGFIPFNLTLVMDGLSGMKIYQKYQVNSNFLPSNYPESLEFLIKNITHEISNNKWTTTLESICTSKPGAIGSVVVVSGGTNSGVGLHPQPPPPLPGGPYTVYNEGQAIRTACELAFHWKYDNVQTDPANTRNGGWSKAGGLYVYDFTAHRVENGISTNTPLMPSPVDGIISKVGYDNKGNSYIGIRASDGSGVYALVHGDNIQPGIVNGASVTRGQLLWRQGRVGRATGVHTHLQFPATPTGLRVLKEYISLLTGVPPC